MKLHKLIFSGLVLTGFLTACHEPDELVREDNGNVMHLTVVPTLIQNGVDYDATIDEQAGVITLNIPYYISDTEEIMSDLSEVKMRATMPLGARFVPGISGIHDFSEGKTFETSLIYEDGTSVDYTFQAVRQKSAKALVTAVNVTDENVRVVFTVTEPSEDSPKGKLTVLKTSVTVEAALQEVKLSVSPWASYEAEGMDPATGIINLNTTKEIKVIAQDGTTANIYEVSIESPAVVPAGNIGYISNMFGVQATAVNPMGFEADANCSIAAVGNYLIVSNKNDFNRMAILNRYSGKQVTDVTINTTGIDAGRQLRAIGTDDDGHLVAATHTCTKTPTDVTRANGWDYELSDPAIKIYVWHDGIQAAPTCIMNVSITGSEMKALKPNAAELFNLLGIKGSLTAGNAVITSTDPVVGRVFAFFFENGTYKEAKVYCPYSNGSAVWLATKNSSRAVPLTTEAPLKYVINGDFRVEIGWNTGTSAGSFLFDAPTSHWWTSTSSADYTKNLRGVDVTEFNGTTLIALANGSLSSGIWSHRLYVANIGNSPSASSLNSGFLFDSREGDAEHGDEANGGPIGTGYSATGMTSTYPFVPTDGTFGGDNLTKRGDVIFVESPDGNSVQVYMFTCNAGVLAYEITRYDM